MLSGFPFTLLPNSALRLTRQLTTTHIVSPQLVARIDLLLDAEAVLVVIPSLERSGREGTKANCQWACRLTRLDACTRCAPRAENRLSDLLGLTAVPLRQYNAAPGPGNRHWQ